MGKKTESVNWQKEFAEFSATDPMPVPVSLTNSVLSQVGSELRPGAFPVFAKTAAIQAFVGAVTLVFCPQFGISYFGNHGVMHFLMPYGESVCMLGCGAFFTMFSLLAASLLLRPEEVRALKENELLQLASLVTLSIGVLLFVGGTTVFSLALIWSLGAILGGGVSLEAGWAFRRLAVRGGLS